MYFILELFLLQVLVSWNKKKPLEVIFLFYVFSVVNNKIKTVFHIQSSTWITETTTSLNKDLLQRINVSCPRHYVVLLTKTIGPGSVVSLHLRKSRIP